MQESQAPKLIVTEGESKPKFVDGFRITAPDYRNRKESRRMHTSREFGKPKMGFTTKPSTKRRQGKINMLNEATKRIVS